MKERVTYAVIALILTAGYFWITPHKSFVVEPDGSVTTLTGKTRAILQRSWFWQRQLPMVEYRLQRAKRNVTTGEDAHRHLRAKADEAEEWVRRLYAEGPESANLEAHILAAQLQAMGKALEEHARQATFLETDRQRLADLESAKAHIQQRAQ